MITAATTDLTSNDTVEFWTEVTIHEMMHVLGLSGSAIANWVDPATGTFHTVASAALLTESVTDADQLTGTLLKSPNLVAYTKDYFNCPTANGLPFENEGGSGSLGSHF
jgi:proprotein convertase subtilisin/kexin type 5